MIYLCWLLFVVVYVFSYKFLVDKRVDVGTDSIKTYPSNVDVIRHYSLTNSTRVLRVVKKLTEEKERKADIREQYLTWRENSKAVNEYYNRRHELLMRSG